MVANQSEEDSEESVYQLEEVGAVQHSKTKQFTISLQVLEEMGETFIQCQIDTGAICNVMTITELCEIKRHGNPVMESTTAKLKLYDGTIIPIVGEATLKCKVNEERYDINFKIISDNQKPLLPGDTCLRLGLITVNTIHAVATEEQMALCRNTRTSSRA